MHHCNASYTLHFRTASYHVYRRLSSSPFHVKSKTKGYPSLPPNTRLNSKVKVCSVSELCALCT